MPRFPPFAFGSASMNVSVPAAWRTSLSGYDRRLWILYTGFVVSSMGFSMVVPFVSLYFHEELGIPMSLVGAFFLVTAVLRASFQAYAGDLSDRVGRVRLMFAGQAGRAVLFGVMAAAVAARLNFWAASGILALSYIAGSFFQPVANAAVADLVERDRRLEAYSLLRVANNLGWGVGPMLGGFVSEIGYAWLFVLGSLASAVSAWLIRRHLTETLPPPSETTRAREGFGDILTVRHDRRLIVFLAFTFFLFTAMSQWISTLPLYASSELGTSRHQLGLMFGMNGLMVVAFQLPVTRAVRRLGLPGAMALGSLVYTVSFIGLSAAGVFWHLLAGMAALTLGELIATPASIAMVSALAPPDRMGRYMGLYSLIASFSWSAGPFVGGVLLDLWIDRPLLLWSVVGSFGAVAAAGFWGMRSRYAPPAPPPGGRP
jgi:MFS family permease